MTETKHQSEKLVVSFVIILILLGLLAIFLDLNETKKVIFHADWRLLSFSLVFTAISYMALSLGFAKVNNIFEVRVPQKNLLEVGFVSIVLNHLLGGAGIAGFSLRAFLFKKWEAQVHKVIAASVFHSYFNNLALIALIPISFVYLLFSYHLSKGFFLSLTIASLVLFMILFLATAMVFIRSVRNSVLKIVERLFKFLKVNSNISSSLGNFDRVFTQAVAEVRKKPSLLFLLITLIAVDWLSSMAVLWFCFDALGNPVKLGVLLTGFAIGVAAGLASFVPGGLGIQEGSMAGVYALLGVPFEQAVLASILFRIVYYFIPFGVSLIFYWRALKEKGTL